VLKSLESLGGKSNSARLRDSLDMSPQTMSYHVKELAKKGLVRATRGERITDQGHIPDNRVILVEITNAGKLVSSWSR
jgi:DNA-binding MarR family transcriptional regulator